ncbi:MAG TPA: hypothetical protein VKA46_20760 [Gemmataceae bacterium]|nr:hypothetical protein [Gemmataceae bacterium]
MDDLTRSSETGGVADTKAPAESVRTAYRCPECGSTDRLAVAVVAWADLEQDGEDWETVLLGANGPDGDTEFTDESAAYCAGCGHYGKVRQFSTDRAK